jgi:hypothetical protein
MDTEGKVVNFITLANLPSAERRYLPVDLEELFFLTRSLSLCLLSTAATLWGRQAAVSFPKV